MQRYDALIEKEDDIYHHLMVTKVVKELEQYDLFSKRIFSLSLRHSDPHGFSLGITYLHTHDILTDKHMSSLFLHSDPVYAAFIYHRLHQIDYLNKETRILLLKYRYNIIHLNDLIDLFYYQKVFDQQNFKNLILYAAIFSKTAVRVAFQEKLETLLSQPIFDTVIQICEQEADANKAAEAIVNFLHRVKEEHDYEQLPFYKKTSLKIESLLTQWGFFPANENFLDLKKINDLAVKVGKNR